MAQRYAAFGQLFYKQSPDPLDYSGNVRTIGPKTPMTAMPFASDIPLGGDRGQSELIPFLYQLFDETGWKPGTPAMNMWIVKFGQETSPPARASSAATQTRSIKSATAPDITASSPSYDLATTEALEVIKNAFECQNSKVKWQKLVDATTILENKLKGKYSIDLWGINFTDFYLDDASNGEDGPPSIGATPSIQDIYQIAKNANLTKSKNKAGKIFYFRKTVKNNSLELGKLDDGHWQARCFLSSF